MHLEQGQALVPRHRGSFQITARLLREAPPNWLPRRLRPGGLLWIKRLETCSGVPPAKPGKHTGDVTEPAQNTASITWSIIGLCPRLRFAGALFSEAERAQ